MEQKDRIEILERVKDILKNINSGNETKSDKSVIVSSKEVIIPKFSKDGNNFVSIFDATTLFDKEMIMATEIKMNRRNFEVLKKDEEYETVIRDINGTLDIWNMVIVIDDSVNEVIISGKKF